MVDENKENKQKYAVDFSEWKGKPNLNSTKVLGGYDKVKKIKYEPTPIKIYYISTVASQIYKDKSGQPTVSAHALAETADGEKVNAYLPEAIYTEFFGTDELRKQNYKKLIVFDKIFHVEYKLREV